MASLADTYHLFWLTMHGQTSWSTSLHAQPISDGCSCKKLLVSIFAKILWRLNPLMTAPVVLLFQQQYGEESCMKWDYNDGIRNCNHIHLPPFWQKMYVDLTLVSAKIFYKTLL